MDGAIECTGKCEYDVCAKMPLHLTRTEQLKVGIAIVSDKVTNALEGTFSAGISNERGEKWEKVKDLHLGNSTNEFVAQRRL